MTALKRALFMDMRRAFFSSRFLLTIMFTLLWLVFNGAKVLFPFHIAITYGIPYIMNYAADGTLALGSLIFPIATIPYSGSYLVDKESGVYLYITERVGVTNYCISKVVSVAVSAFMAGITAMGLFLLVLHMYGVPHTVMGLQHCYLDLVVDAEPWCFYLVRFTLTGLTCSLAAVFSLLITAWIPNTYVGLMAPLVGYYIYNLVLAVVVSITGGSIRLVLLNLNYVIFAQVSTSNGFSFLWAVVYFLTLSVLCGRGFLLLLRKEQGL